MCVNMSETKRTVQNYRGGVLTFGIIIIVGRNTTDMSVIGNEKETITFALGSCSQSLEFKKPENDVILLLYCSMQKVGA